MALHDLHCHLGLMEDGGAFAQEATEHDALLFNNTISPSAYRHDQIAYAHESAAITGIGLHPWYVSDVADDDVEFALATITTERFVGEVGLDAGKRHVENLPAQTRAFEAIVAACAHAGNRLISIHTVGAAEAALDILERSRTLDSCTCIFHWFSGTSNELARAREAGAFFSIGPRMLASKRGRAYAQAIEPERLLLETDAPAEQGAAYSFAQQQTELTEALRILENLRGENLEERLQANAKALLTR